jgi:hypothetical protein
MNKKFTQILSFKSEDLEKQEGKRNGEGKRERKQTNDWLFDQ